MRHIALFLFGLGLLGLAHASLAGDTKQPANATALARR